MTGVLAVVAIGLLIAATIQSATGFGFSLIAGPIVYTVADPAMAVAVVLIFAQVVNLLVLFGERRKLDVDWTAIRPALAAAIPGLPVGAFVISVVPATTMSVAVGVIVCAIAILRLARRSATSRVRPVGRREALVAGFAVGVLTTSTTTNGPPLAVWLTARGMRPAAIRDAVTVIFLTLDLLAIPILLVVAGMDSLPPVSWVLPLAFVAVIGHFVGRRLFLRLPPRAYEPVVLTIAFAAGAFGIGAAVSGASL